mgnify:CR=1 FL=1
MGVALAVAVGGAFGTLSRYGLDRWIERRVDASFPWSTFAINLSGCFLVGFLVAAVVDRQRAPQWLRVGLVVGFCGGYTTFSTFAQETLELLEGRDLALAVVSAVGSVALGVVAVVAGAKVAELV